MECSEVSVDQTYPYLILPSLIAVEVMDGKISLAPIDGGSAIILAEGDVVVRRGIQKIKFINCTEAKLELRLLCLNR